MVALRTRSSKLGRSSSTPLSVRPYIYAPQRRLHILHTAQNARGLPYYFFECVAAVTVARLSRPHRYTDEPWKGEPDDPREGVEVRA
jgi:hypothetical protein